MRWTEEDLKDIKKGSKFKRLSAAEYQALLKDQEAKKPSKYKNQAVTVDDIRFDSKAEARYYQQLKILKAAGEIKEYRLQPRYRLVDGYENGAGKRMRPIDYVADFEVIDKDGQLEIIDVKGHKTAAYKLKKKIFESKYYPNVIKEIDPKEI